MRHIQAYKKAQKKKEEEKKIHVLTSSREDDGKTNERQIEQNIIGKGRGH